MGSPLQEVLPGRGDQKGQGFWLKRGIPLLFLLSSWLSLQAIELTKTSDRWFGYWFVFGGITFCIFTLLHGISKRRDYSLEFLFSFCLVSAGLLRFFQIPWLKVVYFPFFVIIAPFYSLATVITLSLLVPFLELSAFLGLTALAEAASFSLALILTASAASFVFKKQRAEKEDAVSTLKTLRESAQNIAQGSSVDSLKDDEIISSHYASILQTDQEIISLLGITREAVPVADTVVLFQPHDTTCRVRCSTSPDERIIISATGLIHDFFRPQAQREKKTMYLPDLGKKGTSPGYIKEKKISSLIAVPVLSGPSIVGLLTMDSAQEFAFNERERKTAELVAIQLQKILDREKIYTEIRREHDGLRILNDESSGLASSLRTEVIVERLCAGASKIASAQSFFFLAADRGFTLIFGNPDTDIFEKQKPISLKGTFINVAIENTHPVYISDTSSHRDPVMPFKTDTIRSFYAVPLQYENSMLGLFVMISPHTNFLFSFQRRIIEIMCNQATISLANARMHAEIERLATTDGLTGLFNHRVFQERLSAELKRQSRFPEPVSLLLTDIDFFKKVNDSYGHPVGDLVLKGVARLLRETARDIDVTARYGGEEFAVILPGTDSSGARHTAERLRKTVESTAFKDTEGKPLDRRITLSIGIASVPDDARSKEELIERADQALYHAKHSGRNQSVLWKAIR